MKCTCPDIKCTSPDIKCAYFQIIKNWTLGADECASVKKAVSVLCMYKSVNNICFYIK